MRLLLTLIYVKDLPRMAAFYRQALGEAPVTTEETYVEFSNLALHAIPPLGPRRCAGPRRQRLRTPLTAGPDILLHHRFHHLQRRRAGPEKGVVELFGGELIA